MPRVAAVTIDEAVAVIVQFGAHFMTDRLPIWSSEIWKEMSAALDKKWSAGSVYTNVKENRRNILDLARKRMNVTVLKTQDENNNFSLDETEVSEGETSDSSDDDDSWEPGNVQNQNENLDTFDLVLTEEEWTQVKPVQKSSSEEQKVRLTPKVWTNVVARAMWLQYRMPCAFVFKRADVTLSADAKSYAIRIIGKCKSKKCGNTFDGRATKNIGIGGLTMKILTEDTRGKPHEVVKRPLNGKRRKEVQQEVKSEGCAVWKRRQARELMRPGDAESPLIPNDDVIRQTRKEGVDAELDVKKSDGRDLIRTIKELATNPEYCGIIQSIASRPFHLFYRAPAQLHAYKEYCRLNRTSSTIIIDSTGSVVEALDRPDGSKSGHIFLYSIVINFDNTTIAVDQMLSEQHDTEFIEFWLRRWIRAGAPKPKSAVCDYSRALLSALCLAFNNQTLQMYVRCCFSIITQPEVRLPQEPETLLNVDVAHLIHLVCRWKCFKSLKHPSVKEFFVRCVALMVDCVSFADFEKILSLTCAVGVQEHEDAGLDITYASTTKEARKKLENLIATWGIQVDFNIKDPSNKRAKDCPKSFAPNDPEEPTSGNETIIYRWLDRVVTKASITKTAGEDLNPFFLPDFVRNLTRLCLEFPLWTRVGRKNSVRRSTSSYVESYFNYVKNQVFRNKKRPIRVDKFIKIHARDITGATLLGAAKLLRSNTERRVNPSDEPQISEQVSEDVETQPAPQVVIDPDLLSSENWRQKAEPRDPMNLDSTPISWNVDSDSIFVGNQPAGTTDTAESSSVQVVENSPDLDLNINLVCSTPLEDTSQNNELRRLALADHSYSRIDDITGLGNWINDTCSGNTSTPPNRNLPLDEQQKTFANPLNFKANIDACGKQEGDVLAELQPGNLPTERCQPGKTSKFFKPHPEVRHQNSNLSNHKKKAVLLANGLRCREVKVNGKSFFVHRTCSFDSFVQIILTAAIDNNDYFTFIRNSTNSTFQLVLGLIQNGVTQETYRDRLLILKAFCPLTVSTSTEKRVISYSINGEKSIANLVEIVMTSEPSIKNVEECSHCGHRTYSSLLIAPNHKTIGRLGFSGLQAALDFHSPIYNICCRNRCPGKYTLSRELNNHLFIELDIRPNLEATSGLKCKLSQMPTTLHLGQSAEMPYEYRLVGIVGHEPGHYVAYCRRTKGRWQLYNDLSQDIEGCDLETEIEPHLAVYVRTDNRN